MSDFADHPGRQRTPPWTSASLLGLGLVALVGAVLAWLKRGASLSIAGDDTIYYALSEALAHGQYRDTFLVGAPPHAQYPPGTPLWLLLIRSLGGSGIDAVVAANVLLLVVIACLVADAVRRFTSPWLGVVGAALVVWNPAVLNLFRGMDSEPPFIAWCMVSLWSSLADTYSPRRGLGVLAVVAALGAFMTRSAGIALLPAIVGAFLVQRRWKAAIAAALASAGAVVAWFGYVAWATQGSLGHTYADDFSTGPSLEQPLSVVAHGLQNWQTYASRYAAVQFSIPDIRGFPFDNSIWAFLLLVPVAVACASLARRWTALVLFLLLSAGVMFVFPWPIQRLVSVLLPALVAGMLIGWTKLLGGESQLRAQRLAGGLGALLAVVVLVAMIRAARTAQACRASAPFVDARCYLKQDRETMLAIAVLRDVTPSDAVVAASKPAGVAYFSHRRTFPIHYFDGKRPLAELLAPAGPVTHLLLSDMVPSNERAKVAPRLFEDCAKLTPIRRTDSGALILGIRDGDRAPDACRAITRYMRERPTGMEQ